MTSAVSVGRGDAAGLGWAGLPVCSRRVVAGEEAYSSDVSALGREQNEVFTAEIIQNRTRLSALAASV